MKYFSNRKRREERDLSNFERIQYKDSESMGGSKEDGAWISARGWTYHFKLAHRAGHTLMKGD